MFRLPPGARSRCLYVDVPRRRSSSSSRLVVAARLALVEEKGRQGKLPLHLDLAAGAHTWRWKQQQHQQERRYHSTLPLRATTTAAVSYFSSSSSSSNTTRRRFLHSTPPLQQQQQQQQQQQVPRSKDEAKDEANAEALSRPSSTTPTSIRPPSSRETLWTVPNIITMTRIASSPVLSYLIFRGEYRYAVAGLAVAAGSDWLDGYIAKNYNQTSVLGTFLDPLADKVLVAALALPLALQGHVPMPLVFVVVGRDALLIGGSFIKRMMHRPEGAPFFDTTSSATFQITPNLLSKVNTALQFSVLTVALLRVLGGDVMPAALEEVFIPLCWLTGGTTIGSGLTYLAGDGTGSLLRLKKPKKKEDEGMDTSTKKTSTRTTETVNDKK